MIRYSGYRCISRSLACSISLLSSTTSPPSGERQAFDQKWLGVNLRKDARIPADIGVFLAVSTIKL